MKHLTILVFILFSFVSFAEENLLKDEPSEKSILEPTALPSKIDKCECVQKQKDEALANNPKAIESLAFCHDTQEKNNCSKDPALFASWLEAAATRGRGRAIFSLSFLYNFGSGVKKDPKRAADLWAQSARQNLPAGYFMLGQAYADGIGRPKSKEKALKLMKRAEEWGYVRAKERIEELSKSE